MTSPARMLAFHRFRVAALSCMLAACSSSTGAGSADATISLDAPPANQCTAYGQGYECQTGGACLPGYVDKEDYFCGSSGDLCCGPVGEGGVDGSDDANVFVDGAVFETGVVDAAHDGPGDASLRDAGGRDAGHDASMRKSDAAPDAERKDARGDATEDAGHDGGHDAARDAGQDAKKG